MGEELRAELERVRARRDELLHVLAARQREAEDALSAARAEQAALGAERARLEAERARTADVVRQLRASPPRAPALSWRQKGELLWHVVLRLVLLGFAVAGVCAVGYAIAFPGAYLLAIAFAYFTTNVIGDAADAEERLDD